jgi:hypothetical protein
MASGALDQNVTKAEHWAVDTDRTISFQCTDQSGGRLDLTSIALQYKLIKGGDSLVFEKLTSDNGITLGSSEDDAILDIAIVHVYRVDTARQLAGSDYYHHLLALTEDESDYLAQGTVVLTDYGREI